MRQCIPGIITDEDAAALSTDVGYLDLCDFRLSGIIAGIRSLAPIDLSDPSYARVEKRPQGHPWHTDAGNKHGGVRGWCRWSAGVLLTPTSQFDGGGLYFRDDMHTAIHHYCDLWVWDGDEEHCATSHNGDRRVLIMFFRGIENG